MKKTNTVSNFAEVRFDISFVGNRDTMKQVLQLLMKAGCSVIALNQAGLKLEQIAALKANNIAGLLHEGNVVCGREETTCRESTEVGGNEDDNESN